MVAAVTSSHITQELVEAFDRDGFVVARQLFAPDEVKLIGETFMEMGKNGPVEGLSENVHWSSKAGYSDDDPLKKYPRMMMPHWHRDKIVGPVALKYMLDARVGEILKALMRQEPIAVQSMFYFKPPGARGQDLHQDDFYLKTRPGRCVAAWAAIDDADEENGGMVAVPGSNRLEIQCPEKSDPTKFFTTEHVPVPEGMKEVPVNMKAGDVMFFNGSVIHGSYPNRSKTRFRRAFICHYVPESTAELSHWYRTPMRFDGVGRLIPAATGGGPCGNVQDAGKLH